MANQPNVLDAMRSSELYEYMTNFLGDQVRRLYKFCVMFNIINQFKRNVISHSYQLEPVHLRFKSCFMIFFISI